MTFDEVSYKEKAQHLLSNESTESNIPPKVEQLLVISGVGNALLAINENLERIAVALEALDPRNR